MDSVHPTAPPIEAAMRADAMLDKGDLDGQRVWLRIPSTGQGVDARPGASGRFDKTAESAPQDRPRSMRSTAPRLVREPRAPAADIPSRNVRSWG